MRFKYSFQDWENGIITWNSIISSKYETDFISENCIAKINSRQKEIFIDQAKLYLDSLVKNYNLKRRSDTNRPTTLNKLLQTIDNLFNGDVLSFENTTLLDEEQALTESIPIEYKKKVIPPLDLVEFDKIDIEFIQEKFKHYINTGVWDFSVVDTPSLNDLQNNIDYYTSIAAKAYYDFKTRLNSYEGHIYNTFNCRIDDYILKQICVDLKRDGFISEESSTTFFPKIFKGYYVLQKENVTWLKNQECLNYFISQMKGHLTYNKDYGLWGVTTNCFSGKDFVFKKSSLRRAKKIDKYPNYKAQIDKILSRVK